jgi:hypothetical protein
MDLTSHPPNWPIPAPGTMSRADVAAHTAASHVRTAPTANADDICPDCQRPSLGGHVCKPGNGR